MKRKRSKRRRPKCLLLRVPEELHACLKEVSWQQRMTLNSFCTLRLLDAVRDCYQGPLPRPKCI